MSMLLALAACSGTGATTGTVERTWTGDFLVDSVIIDCNGVTEWTYDVWTQGWGEKITVDVRARAYGTLIFNEHHELAEVDYDDATAHFQVVLDQVAYAEEYQSSRATALACDMKTYVTYGIGAWGYDGELSECIAYGVDPEGEYPDCTSWGTGH